MRLYLHALLAVVVATAAGCSTTQRVVLAKADSTKVVQTVAQVRAADNSADMDANLQSALQKESLSIKATLPAGTRKSSEVDALVSYTDVWRWDLVMYLKSLSISMYDAETGDLLVTGQWSDSALHAFRDSKLVMQNLLDEMFGKLRSATAAKQASN